MLRINPCCLKAAHHLQSTTVPLHRAYKDMRLAFTALSFHYLQETSLTECFGSTKYYFQQEKADG